MTISNIVLRGLKEITDLLDKEKIEWCLFGGLAMQPYRRIRATKDVDLMVGVSPEDFSTLVSHIKTAGFNLAGQNSIIKINDFKVARFIYTDKESGFGIFVDIVGAATEFQKGIIARKLKIDFLGVPVNVASFGRPYSFEASCRQAYRYN